ncbi:MAG: ParA family protein [Pseudomonadota bacterium]
MRNTIAVMNTKGGVGKSTLVLGLAETLSSELNKTVLVIDSDSQATLSSMLMTVNNLYALQRDGLTIVDYLVARVLREAEVDWASFIARNVSDVDDAKSVFLFPSDMQLTLFEREVSKEGRHTALRASITEILSAVRSVFDVVLIDCPPGLSILTESWLREADFHISPTKADYVSVCGLEVFRRFKALNPEMGFADNLGVVVNMMDANSSNDVEYLKWLRSSPENKCFQSVVPRMNALQDAARFRTDKRSYSAKYPGPVGHALKDMAAEVLQRLEAANAIAAASTPPAPPPVQPQTVATS